MHQWLAGEDSLLFKGFVAAKNNPYDAEENPSGIVNLGKKKRPHNVRMTAVMN